MNIEMVTPFNNVLTLDLNTARVQDTNPLEVPCTNIRPTLFTGIIPFQTPISVNGIIIIQTLTLI